MAYFFFDIDGTLASHKQGLVESARVALEQLRKDGHLVFLSTGRHLKSLNVVRNLAVDGVLFCNGAGILYHDQILSFRPIPHDLCSHLVMLAEERNGAYSLMTKDVSFKNEAEIERMRHYVAYDKRYKTLQEKLEDFGAMPFTSYRRQEILKVDIGFASEAIMDDFLKVLDPRLHLASTAGYHVDEGKRSGEITLAGVNKGTAITILMDKLGGSMEDTYAFGDSSNDLEMLKMAGHGIAMGNGFEEVKAIADFVTKDVDDDGIQFALQQFGFIQ